ncbi:hypothetical protein A6P54_01650 [Bacillus sp. MKU004]|nr:hypothetical protein A6P54_01650 [Bacillus sp. MKU004]
MNGETEAAAAMQTASYFIVLFCMTLNLLIGKRKEISKCWQGVKCSNFLNIVLGMNIELMLYWYIIL